MTWKRSLSLLVVLLMFVLNVACGKKESQTNQASQTPAASTPTTPAAQPAPAPSVQPAPTTASQEKRAAATEQKRESTAEKPAAARSAVVVPSGTPITIRLGSQISSKTSQPGETFTGSTAQPVVVNGKTVIPEGAKVNGEVVNAKPAGKIKGGAQLSLRLNSIEVRGQTYPVRTSFIARTGKGKGKRTAVMGGGGAGAGALIGGLAGGGKGALIGALAGGAAGTAGSAFTGNVDITLPVESALTFRLAAPLKMGPQ